VAAVHSQQSINGQKNIRNYKELKRQVET